MGEEQREPVAVGSGGLLYEAQPSADTSLVAVCLRVRPEDGLRGRWRASHGAPKMETLVAGYPEPRDADVGLAHVDLQALLLPHESLIEAWLEALEALSKCPVFGLKAANGLELSPASFV